MEIKVSKGRNGWQAESYLPLNDTLNTNQQLRILTDRRESLAGCQIVTTAYVVTVENGIVRYALNYGVGNGDYKECLIERTGVRATEKTIRAQHQEAIANLENLKARIAHHYALQAARQKHSELAQAA